MNENMSFLAPPRFTAPFTTKKKAHPHASQVTPTVAIDATTHFA